MLDWISSWLTNRRQRVCIQGKFSSWILVTSGVPEGSHTRAGVISLFLIFINDLDMGIENWILKFSDDTKIFSELSQVKDCDKLQKDLELLHKWSVDWQMQFNTEKCKVMHIGRHNTMFTYTIENKQLEAVKQERDLRFIIAEDLKPSAHCTERYTKANRMLGLIKRTVSSRQPGIMLNLYKSIVRPHLEYGSSA